MENFDMIWAVIGGAVLALLPVVTILVNSVGSDQAKARWGKAVTVITRIFSVSTTRSTKTGKAALSMPLIGNPIHPDDR